MGDVRHWVFKFNPALIAAISIAGFFAIAVANIIASAIKPIQISMTIVNGKEVRAFEVIDGKMVPIRVPKK